MNNPERKIRHKTETIKTELTHGQYEEFLEYIESQGNSGIAGALRCLVLEAVYKNRERTYQYHKEQEEREKGLKSAGFRTEAA